MSLINITGHPVYFCVPTSQHKICEGCISSLQYWAVVVAAKLSLASAREYREFVGNRSNYVVFSVTSSVWVFEHVTHLMFLFVCFVCFLALFPRDSFFYFPAYLGRYLARACRACCADYDGITLHSLLSFLHYNARSSPVPQLCSEGPTVASSLALTVSTGSRLAGFQRIITTV